MKVGTRFLRVFFTNEETRLYTCVNTALRRQRAYGFRPTAEDLVLGPYILMYQLLLLFWVKLEKESKTTYRKMILSKSHQDKYRKGDKFTWLSFVSSSINFAIAKPFPTVNPDEETCVHPTIFIFDNSCNCGWQPRNRSLPCTKKRRESILPGRSSSLPLERMKMANLEFISNCFQLNCFR